MIEKTKALEIGEIYSKTDLNTFASNVFLTLKIMNFENVFLTNIYIYIMLFKAWKKILSTLAYMSYKF